MSYIEKREREASSSRQRVQKCLLFFYQVTLHIFLLFLFCKMSLSRNRKGPPPEPLWKSSDRKARKQGFHATIYSADGSHYKGDWENDKRHGENVFFNEI